ncbi:MAG: ComEA family DNA-binding protein [Anaerolineae bacterium]|jgi:competence protein ComEA|nr:ComEA family DNA-binding protein [Anaerolineae bacterium]
MITRLGKRGNWVLLLLSYALVAGIAFFAARWPAPGGVQILTPEPSPTHAPSPTPAPVRVYVSGAVVAPGVYTLPPGSIAQDALLAAGGPAQDADLSLVNLAALVSNGQQVHIPRVGEKVSQKSQATAIPTPSGPLNLNTATAAELEQLPGIGPALAARIVQYRQEHGPFRTVDALLLVSGIGPSTLNRIRSLVTVD